VYIIRCRKMCKVTCYKNYENNAKIVKVRMKNKVAPFYLGHSIVVNYAVSVAYCLFAVLESKLFMVRLFGKIAQCFLLFLNVFV